MKIIIEHYLSPNDRLPGRDLHRRKSLSFEVIINCYPSLLFDNFSTTVLEINAEDIGDGEAEARCQALKKAESWHQG